MGALFPLGQIVATPGALDALTRAEQTPKHPQCFNIVPQGVNQKTVQPLGCPFRRAKSYPVCLSPPRWRSLLGRRNRCPPATLQSGGVSAVID